ncbi:MAG: gluconokinase [Gammaproteobacteria bacterium]|nr:gluconokinase [Gammaproteobacteria bacterium]
MQSANRYPLLVAGVSGSGKSTLAQRWALRCAAPFIEGDRLHAPAGIAKMRAGIALEDEDRAAWLDRLTAEMHAHDGSPGPVLACSALKRSYRERLRAGVPGLRVALLVVTPALAEQRVGLRAGHYMPVALVASQFATLELPVNEPHTLLLDGSRPLAALLSELGQWLAAS